MPDDLEEIQPVTLLPPGQLLGQMADFSLENAPTVTIARNIGGLTFDAVISESHVSELVVTENPIETGVNIADHCFMRPLRVIINAVVSDIKMPSASNQYDGSPSGRVRTAFQMLQQQQIDLSENTIQPFLVYTGLKVYDNMVCTLLSATQDVGTASLLAFTAELTQVKMLSTAYTTYERLPTPAPKKPARQANPPQNNGPQQPQTPETQAPKGGVLARALNAGYRRITGSQENVIQAPTTPPQPQAYARFGPFKSYETNLYHPIR